MPLLKPKRRGAVARVLRAHGALRCPLNGHQVSWCRGLCTPVGDRGLCGRLAPHAMVGRTQMAILGYRDRPLHSSAS